MTQRGQTGVTTFFGGPETAVSPSVIPAKAGTQKRLRSFDKNRHIQKTKKMDSRLRENDKKNVSRITLNRRPHLAAAFTMVEMLVSLMVMILLMGITAVIYKSANDAMHLSNSEVVVVDDFNSLTEQVDITMDNVCTDGYLVIYGYDVREDTGDNEITEKNAEGKILFDGSVLPSVRSDAICFLTTGSFNSLTNQAIAANSGWVYLGHAGLINPSTYGSSPFDTVSTNKPLVPNSWVFSRYMLLFTPGQAGSDYRNTSMGAYLAGIQAFAAGAADSAIREWFYDNWITNNTSVYTPPRINFDNEEFKDVTPHVPANYTFPYTLPNVGSIKIEFAMPKSYFNVADPNDEPEQYTDTAKTIVWRSAIDLRPYNPNDLTEQAVEFPDTSTPSYPNPVNAHALNKRSNDGIVVFGPDDVWPLFIKITIRKYDEDLAIVTDERFLYDGDKDKTHLHGGRTLEYIYKLPVKN